MRQKIYIVILIFISLNSILYASNLNLSTRAIKALEDLINSSGEIAFSTDNSGNAVIDGSVWPSTSGSIGQYLQTDGSGTLSWATISNVAPADAQYITLAVDGALSNERVLTAGTDISLVDGGAGTTVTLATTSTLQTVTDRGATTTNGITALSYTIGANTLDTNEWAFLDGQDQDVSSAASPTFTGTNFTGVPQLDAGDSSIVVSDTGTGDLQFTIDGAQYGTWTAADGFTVQGNNGNAAWTGLTITNTDQPENGETGQTVALDFYVRGTINNSDFDDYIVGKIYGYKESDYYAADANSNDGGLRILGVSNNVVTGRQLQTSSTGAEIRATNATSGTPSISFFSATNTGFYKSGSPANSFGISTDGEVFGYFSKSNGFLLNRVSGATIDANQISIGRDGVILEGATADAYELSMLFPTIDPNADITTYFLTSKIATAGGAQGEAGLPTGSITQTYHVRHDELTNESGTTTDVVICTLPTKAFLQYALIVVTEQGVHSDTLNLSLGSAAADYDQIILDQDGKAAANTVYGDEDSERSTDLPDADATGMKLYSWTATQAITLHADGNAANLSAANFTAGEYDVVITYLVPPTYNE